MRGYSCDVIHWYRLKKGIKKVWMICWILKNARSNTTIMRFWKKDIFFISFMICHFCRTKIRFKNAYFTYKWCHENIMLGRFFLNRILIIIYSKFVWIQTNLFEFKRKITGHCFKNLNLDVLHNHISCWLRTYIFVIFFLSFSTHINLQ